MSCGTGEPYAVLLVHHVEELKAQEEIAELTIRKADRLELIGFLLRFGLIGGNVLVFVFAEERHLLVVQLRAQF